jgi:hypothetical protein
MTRIRCPQDRCIFNLDGICDADEIELDASTLACITFEEVDYEAYRVTQDIDDDELEWDDEDPLWAEELDESLYEVVTDDEDDEEEELIADDDDDEEGWR